MVQKTAKIPGGQLAYWTEDKGADRWLVLLHEAAADHTMFDSLLPLLPAGWNVLAPDLRAHGASALSAEQPFRIEGAVRDLSAMLQYLNIEKAVLVGISMGGIVAQHLQHQYPAPVIGMVLVSAPDIALPLSLPEKIMLKAGIPALKAMPTEKLIKTAAYNSGTTAAARTLMEKGIRAMGKDRALQVMDEVSNALRPDKNHRFSIPVLSILGGDDGASATLKSMKTWPNRDSMVRLSVVPGAGHLPNLDKPEETAKVIRTFLTQF